MGEIANAAEPGQRKTESANRELYSQSTSEVYYSTPSADNDEELGFSIIFDPRRCINFPRLMQQR